MFEDLLVHKELLLKLYNNGGLNAEECPRSFIKYNLVKLRWSDNVPTLALLTTYGRKFIERHLL